MLRGKALSGFGELKSQYGGATNNYPKLIQEGLLYYFFLVNVLSDQERVMRRAIRKP